jgi:hypothetical protein
MIFVDFQVTMSFANSIKLRETLCMEFNKIQSSVDQSSNHNFVLCPFNGSESIRIYSTVEHGSITFKTLLIQPSRTHLLISNFHNFSITTRHPPLQLRFLLSPLNPVTSNPLSSSLTQHNQ